MTAEAAELVFPGDGETTRRMRALDDRGPSWVRRNGRKPPPRGRYLPPSPWPTQIAWGAHLTLLHDDACIPLLATRHPQLLGRTGRDSWNEIERGGTAARFRVREQPHSPTPTPMHRSPDCPACMRDTDWRRREPQRGPRAPEDAVPKRGERIDPECETAEGDFRLTSAASSIRLESVARPA